MKQRERRESRTSNRMRKGVRRGERKKPLAPYLHQTTAQRVPISCRYFTQIPIIFCWGERKVAYQGAAAEHLTSSEVFHLRDEVDLKKINPRAVCIQVSSKTFKRVSVQEKVSSQRFYFIELVIGKSLTGWSIACLTGMGSKKWF